MALSPITFSAEQHELAILRTVASWAHRDAPFGELPGVLTSVDAELSRAVGAATIFVAHWMPSAGVARVLNDDLLLARYVAFEDVQVMCSSLVGLASLGQSEVQAELDAWARRGVAGPRTQRGTWSFTSWVEGRTGRAATLARAWR